ncbi:MAG: DUF1467 family protein [Pararhizobium sp.]
MPWYSYFAIFFILWWIVLFAVLPFGATSQHEADEIVPGTDGGAPVRVHFWSTVWVTTAVALVIFAAYYVVTAVLGYSFDDIPSIVPKYQ